MNQLEAAWYIWASFAALVIALLCAFWIFYDAERRNRDAALWKGSSVFAVTLIVPSVIFATAPNLALSLPNARMPLMLLGIAATVLALLGVALHSAGITVGGGLRCANCGRPRDPSWPYCPYCEYDKPRVAPQPMQPASSNVEPQTLLNLSANAPTQNSRADETLEMRSLPLETDARRDETMQLDAVREASADAAPAPATRILKVLPKLLAYLVVRSGLHEGKIFPLDADTRIGRQADVNDIVLDDDSISREHARVKFQDNTYFLYDLASGNHTYIRTSEEAEWQEIQKHALADGMNIKLGETVLAFMLVDTRAANAPSESAVP